MPAALMRLTTSYEIAVSHPLRRLDALLDLDIDTSVIASLARSAWSGLLASE